MAAINCILSKPSDPVQHRNGQISDFGSISALLQQILNRASQGFRVRVDDRICSDVGTVLFKGWVIHCRIPVLSLPCVDAVANHVCEIIIVSDVWEAECALELRFRAIVVAEEDVVHHMGDLLGIENARLFGIETDGLVVSPIIPDSFNDSTGGNSAYFSQSYLGAAKAWILGAYPKRHPGTTSSEKH